MERQFVLTLMHSYAVLSASVSRSWCFQRVSGILPLHCEVVSETQHPTCFRVPAWMHAVGVAFLCFALEFEKSSICNSSLRMEHKDSRFHFYSFLLSRWLLGQTKLFCAQFTILTWFFKKNVFSIFGLLLSNALVRAVGWPPVLLISVLWALKPRWLCSLPKLLSGDAVSQSKTGPS